MTPEEAENWPHKNVIVRALGMKESVQVDILTEKPHVGDTYLLCSDGLTGMIKDDQMQHILMTRARSRSRGRAPDPAANEEGGVDNISVVLARDRGGVSGPRAVAARARRVRGVQEAGGRAARRGDDAPAPIPAERGQARRGRVQGVRRQGLRLHRTGRRARVRAGQGAARRDHDRARGRARRRDRPARTSSRRTTSCARR